MELWFYDNSEGKMEFIDKGLDLQEAIESAKDQLELFVDQDEIDDERFHITDDEDDQGRPIKRVYLVSNMWTGIVSDFYAEIRDES